MAIELEWGGGRLKPMKDTLKSAKVYREVNYYSYLAFKKFYNRFWSRVYFEWKGGGVLYTEFSLCLKVMQLAFEKYLNVHA